MQRNIYNREESYSELGKDQRTDLNPGTSIEASTDIDSEVAQLLKFMEEDPEYFKQCAAEFRRWGSGDPPGFLLKTVQEGEGPTEGEGEPFLVSREKAKKKSKKK